MMKVYLVYNANNYFQLWDNPPSAPFYVSGVLNRTSILPDSEKLFIILCDCSIVNATLSIKRKEVCVW